MADLSRVARLHEAVKRGDLAAMKRLLQADSALANARSATDARGTYPLHVAAEHNHAAAGSSFSRTAPTYRCSIWRTNPSRSAGRRSSGGPKSRWSSSRRARTSTSATSMD
jgi:hypothetical protein